MPESLVSRGSTAPFFASTRYAGFTPHMADNTVIIYDPNGNPEKHTRPNARDLVVGAGYTWSRFVPANPAAYAPFATVTPPEGPAPSQRVLDRATGKDENGQSPAASQAAQALQQQQAAMAAAIAQQQALEAAAAQAALVAQAEVQAKAAAAAAAAAHLPEPAVKDFSAAPAEDASDLDDEDAIDVPAVEDAADTTTVAKTPRRGRKVK
ncbi:hypothetical protein BAMBUS_04920 [Brevundimonas phage vB_BpoS-Bambus]|nr:hypothetical protein BAMBUS_04920 [Brevundimonas phage vB_BpoS-Bambus]